MDGFVYPVLTEIEPHLQLPQKKYLINNKKGYTTTQLIYTQIYEYSPLY